MSQTLLERVADRFRGRAEKQQKSFLELVQQIADGHEAKVEEVEKILLAIGKSPDDLAAAVSVLQHRKKLRATLERGRQAASQRSEVEAALVKCDAVFEAAVQGARDRRQATRGPLEQQLRQIETAERNGVIAAAELRDAADKPEVRAQITQLEGQIAEAKRRHNHFLAEANRAERDAGEACYQLSMPQSENNPALNTKNYREAARERMERFGALAEKHRKDAEPHAAQVAELEGQVAALEAKLLDP
jgi:hypothetical protein